MGLSINHYGFLCRDGRTWFLSVKQHVFGDWDSGLEEP